MSVLLQMFTVIRGAQSERLIRHDSYAMESYGSSIRGWTTALDAHIQHSLDPKEALFYEKAATILQVGGLVEETLPLSLLPSFDETGSNLEGNHPEGSHPG